MCGGITGAKKIAALAEAHYVGVVPHNPLGPVSTAAYLQLAACIPNFTLQEYPLGEDTPPKSEIVTRPLRREGGYLLIPTTPGIGIELAEDAAGEALGPQFPPELPRVLAAGLPARAQMRLVGVTSRARGGGVARSRKAPARTHRHTVWRVRPT